MVHVEHLNGVSSQRFEPRQTSGVLDQGLAVVATAARAVCRPTPKSRAVWATDSSSAPNSRWTARSGCTWRRPPRWAGAARVDPGVGHGRLRVKVRGPGHRRAGRGPGMGAAPVSLSLPDCQVGSWGTPSNAVATSLRCFTVKAVVF